MLHHNRSNACNQLHHKRLLTQARAGIRLAETSSLVSCRTTTHTIVTKVSKLLDEHFEVEKNLCNAKNKIKKLPCLGYVINREFTDKKRNREEDVFDDLSKKVRMDSMKTKRQQRLSKKILKKKRKNAKKVEDEKNEYVTVPVPPRNQVMFTPQQAFDHLSSAGNDRALILKHWIEHELVPVKKTFLYNMLRTKNVPEVWNKDELKKTIVTGRPRLLEKKDIELIVEEIGQKKGKGGTEDKLKELIKETVGKKLKDKNRYSPAGSMLSSQTMRNYTNLCITNEKLKIVNSFQQKTENRIIAENSFIGAAAYLFTVAANHFIIGSPPKNYHKNVDIATEGAQMLAKFVSNANKNAEIYPVHPGLITTSDEQVSFVFSGEAKKPKEWIAVKSEFVSHQHSVFTNEKGGTDHLNGLRVRMNHTFNGMGATAAIYLTV